MVKIHLKYIVQQNVKKVMGSKSHRKLCTSYYRFTCLIHNSESYHHILPCQIIKHNVRYTVIKHYSKQL